jgi:hypothetical protein
VTLADIEARIGPIKTPSEDTPSDDASRKKPAGVMAPAGSMVSPW